MGYYSIPIPIKILSEFDFIVMGFLFYLMPILMNLVVCFVGLLSSYVLTLIPVWIWFLTLSILKQATHAQLQY